MISRGAMEEEWASYPRQQRARATAEVAIAMAVAAGGKGTARPGLTWRHIFVFVFASFLFCFVSSPLFSLCKRSVSVYVGVPIIFILRLVVAQKTKPLTECLRTKVQRTVLFLLLYLLLIPIV